VVVADEVRGLSGRTQEAAEEIKSRIDHLNQQVDDLSATMKDNVSAVSSTGSALTDTGERFASITASVLQTKNMISETQAITDQELSRNAEIKEHIDEIRRLSQASNERAINVGQSSALLNQLASSLKQMLSGASDSLEVKDSATVDLFLSAMHIHYET